MTVRAVIEFPDDCADAVTEWATVEAARRWGAAMERLTPGAVAMDLERRCDDHGRWEDLHTCGQCGEPCCINLDRCGECPEPEAECACPGENVAACHCPACVA